MEKEPYYQMLDRCNKRNIRMIAEYMRGKKSACDIYRPEQISRQRFFQILDAAGVTKRHEPERARRKK